MSQTMMSSTDFSGGSTLRANGGKNDGGDLPPIIAARTVHAHVPAGRWSWLPWKWSNRRQQTLDSYTRLAALLDTLQGHFDRQDSRAGELNGLLERLAHTIEAAAVEQRTHSGQNRDQIASIAGSTASMAATLGELPAAMQAQAAAIRAVAQQAEVSQEVDVQLMHSLQRFTPTLEAMRDSSQANLHALEKLLKDEQVSRAGLTAFVEKQSRRLMTVTVAAGVLTLLAVAAAGFLFLRALQ